MEPSPQYYPAPEYYNLLGTPQKYQPRMKVLTRGLEDSENLRRSDRNGAPPATATSVAHMIAKAGSLLVRAKTKKKTQKPMADYYENFKLVVSCVSSFQWLPTSWEH